MQCLVLAGGLGTRMARFTTDAPKALIPVLGRPFVEWQLEWLAGQGVADVVFSIGYRGAQLREVVGDGRRFGLGVRYVDEGQRLRGTAGAVRLALDRGVVDPAFFVLYGDSFLSVDMQAVWEAFSQRGVPALMTVFANHGQGDRSNVVFSDGRVARYDKHAPPSPEVAWIDYGLSVLSAAVVTELVPAGAVADLAEVYRRLSVDGRLGGFEVTERFYEVGSEEGLASLEAHLARP